jgi:hypothetical protein
MWNDLEPDHIICVHRTKVIDDQICATIYLKGTDCQPLYTYMSRSLRTSHLGVSSLIEQSSRMQEFVRVSNLSEEEKQQVEMYSQSEIDLLVYYQVNMVLTICATTKKVVGMEFNGKLSSVAAANINNMEY